MKGPDGLCTDCGCTHDLWHAENPAEWEYREGCACYLCQEQERKMSQSRLEQKYQCWNDCLPQGCPGHTAVLQYQSVSNSLHFSDGKGNEMYMQTPELEAFLSMLHTLGKSRTEIESVLKKHKGA